MVAVLRDRGASRKARLSRSMMTSFGQRRVELSLPSWTGLTSMPARRRCYLPQKHPLAFCRRHQLATSRMATRFPVALAPGVTARGIGPTTEGRRAQVRGSTDARSALRFVAANGIEVRRPNVGRGTRRTRRYCDVCGPDGPCYYLGAEASLLNSNASPPLYGPIRSRSKVHRGRATDTQLRRRFPTRADSFVVKAPSKRGATAPSRQTL